jgi:short-subunit dehydrogenase
MKKYICIIGSTSGLGYSITKTLAQNKNNRLLLVSRNMAKLIKTRKYLIQKYGTEVDILRCDLSKFDGNDFKKSFLKINLLVDEIYCVAGYSSKQDKGDTNVAEANKISSVNGISFIHILNILCKRHLSETAKIVIISSVACIRPRSANIIYSASKLALEAYAMSLKHKFSEKKIYIFRMGYIKTKMLANQKILLPAIDADEAAKKILLVVKNKNAGNFYVPVWWNLVSIAIRLSPWWVFKRLRV